MPIGDGASAGWTTMVERDLSFASNHRRRFRIGVPLLPPLAKPTINVHILSLAGVTTEPELLPAALVAP